MLYVAVLPTNQDKNVTLHGSTEMAHIAPVAVELTARLSNIDAISVKLFTPKPESNDAFKYQQLRAQQVEAREWLSKVQGDKLAINLHSDAGAFSHVGFFYRDAKGEVLGAEIASPLKTLFNTTSVLSADYSDYIFAIYPAADTTPILLELGSHQNESDYAMVRDHPDSVAAVITDAIGRFYDINLTEGEDIDWTDAGIGFYSSWAKERIANKEDPRDGVAFVKHLRAIGKLRDARYYGWPC